MSDVPEYEMFNSNKSKQFDHEDIALILNKVREFLLPKARSFAEKVKPAYDALDLKWYLTRESVPDIDDIEKTATKLINSFGGNYFVNAIYEQLQKDGHAESSCETGCIKAEVMIFQDGSYDGELLLQVGFTNLELYDSEDNQ
jgi:hypothetical protein